MTQQIFARGAILVLAPLGAAFAATPVDRQVPADSNGVVEIRNVAGAIEVVGGNRRDVHVTGTLADNVERLDVEADGGRVTVKVVLLENWRSRSWDGTELTIEVPQGSELRVDAVSASVDVRGVQGEQRLASVSGRIDVQDVASNLNVSSVSGNVSVRGSERDALTRAKSVSGRVDIDGVDGELYADSISGDVNVEAKSVSRVQLSSISGNVTLRSGLRSDSRVEAQTTSGNLRFVILGDAAGEYDLSSFSGNIRNCFGPPAPGPAAVGPPSRQHRFREGTADARVRANTMSGTIDVCKQ
jgi:DUF4097 and DUF4098 domain-containing protein YvlB